MTATAEAHRQVAMFANQADSPFTPKFARRQNHAGASVLAVAGLPIFRSGTFRDSLGFESTWEDIHMHTMVSNFQLLRDSKTFADVPVRAGHPEIFSNNMKNLIGYFTGLRAEKATSPVDGAEYTYLLADLDILDADAQQRIESGLWRNRSSEIGFYSSNSNAEYWPVVVGVAYVDIPAVEGLNFSKFEGAGKDYSILMDSNKEVSPVGDNDSKNTQQHAAPPAPASPPAPPKAFEFKLGDQTVSDYAAVQAHIDAQATRIAELDQFEKETKEAGRKAFVASLTDSKKILAAQQPGLEAFAVSLSDEQFANFQASYAAAAEVPLLGEHVVSAETYGTPDGAPKGDPVVEKNQRIFARHLMSGNKRAMETQSAQFLLSKGLIDETGKPVTPQA